MANFQKKQRRCFKRELPYGKAVIVQKRAEGPRKWMVINKTELKLSVPK